MTSELVVLSIAATSIGFFHTLFGPDHYLPFIAMAKSRKWSLNMTVCITSLCGLGHIASSIILGIVGIGLGISVNKLNVTESFRGDIAAWLLIAFGLVYFVWGVRKAIRNKSHSHSHNHAEEEGHSHNHTHEQKHLHVHAGEKSKNITPWILFTIFFFGPCEPLIPMLMYPAAKNSMFGAVLITGLFGLITIVTMLGIVVATSFGLNFLPLRRLERYTHALAGATICICGLSIQFLGL